MKLYGIIGYPLSHSFSKKYFTEKFQKENLTDCAYENFPLQNIDEFPALIARHSDLKGLNVTIPYKEVVVPYLHEKNEIVKSTGACNCIKIVNGKLKGFNTDVFGFEKSLQAKLRPNHKKALILGTGGAAKAVQFVFEKKGISYKYVSRKKSAENLSYDELSDSLIQDYQLIINCTPLGMYPKINEAPPIPYGSVSKDHLLFDLIYNPDKTLFLIKGEKQGASIQNGLDMLIFQAEENWTIWNA